MPVYEYTLGGKYIKLEFDSYAKQADGAVMISIEDSYLLVAATCALKPTETEDFFPLSVEYREKAYAAGRIPGGFFKREGKPSEKEILSSRMVDRSIRPLFPKDFKNEVQINLFVVSFDGQNDPDVLGIMGASAALSVSNIPFGGPIGGVRVGYIDGSYVLNPTLEEREISLLDIVVAGTGDSIIMVEGGGKEVSESVLLGAFKFAMPYLGEQVELQKKIAAEIGKPKRVYPVATLPETLVERIEKEAEKNFEAIFSIREKKQRNLAFTCFKEALVESLKAEFPDSESQISEYLEELRKRYTRRLIVEKGIRLDGRKPNEIRPISCKVGVLPRTHGSALFTRGETQALCVLTLGTKLDEQKIEDLEGESFKSFLLHYNFPPFSVGEVKPVRGPGRREIGHGALAERSLAPVIPSEDEFPYTIRIVSDILESNGSSSMATVCAGSLALMDAGVPIKEHIAGVAMGLVKEGDKEIILTDIIGDEDHYGDMDFKSAGTKNGITGFQMDVKIPGLSFDLLQRALEQAKEARLFILERMRETIARPRESLSKYAPRIAITQIPPDKIGELIGTGGKVIRAIQEESGATINIESDGRVLVASTTPEGVEIALRRIKEVTAEPELGAVYEGVVKRIVPFGAFVEILPNSDGLLHISEIDTRRLNRVEDVLKEGDKVMVKVIGIDEDGKIRLSRKALIKKDERKK